MRYQLIGTSILLGMCAAVAAAQPPAPPQPGAEQKNLAAFAGTWKMDGKMEASPFGPAGTMTGTETCRVFEGGWHLVCDSSSTGPFGAMKGHAVMTYDRGTKQYRYFSINNMPDAEMAVGTKSGNVWTWTSEMDMGGKTIHSRFVITEESPTMHSFKWETSEDGKSWKTTMTGKSTKTT
jgi:hypothetical protein